MLPFLFRAALASTLTAVLLSAYSLAADAEAFVKGTVTVDGKPVTEGKVILHAKVGKPVETPIKDGKYMTAKVPTGVKTVTIEGKGVPAKYSSAETSPLKAEIVAGENELVFELID